MYPFPVFLGLTLYDIFLCLGIIICFFVFGLLADKRKISRRVQNFALGSGAVSIVVGYGSAVLFQGLYNIKSVGSFELTAGTGATFYGGLIGGALTFLVLYFGVGYFVFDKMSHARCFFPIADCAVTGIAIAHSLGRIGCLTAGCCHGALTDAWYGIYMYGTEGYGKYVPTQLFEAVFLLFLFGFLLLMCIEKRGYCLSAYLCIYAVWRFALEFIRADDRGDVFVEALTPSQLIACILFAVGIGVIFIERYVRARLSVRQTNERTVESNEKA